VLGIPADADVDIVTIVELVPTEIDRTTVVLSEIQKKKKHTVHRKTFDTSYKRNIEYS
jgi:hypothetical protein